MSKQNDGGAAFPTVSTEPKFIEGCGGGTISEVKSAGGMTLRLYAAIEMMKTIVPTLKCKLPLCDHFDIEIAVQHAFRLADAIIAENQKERP